VTLKLFIGIRGFESHPVELSQQPERVLRRGAVTIPAKRRQRVQKPCESASKAPISEPSFWIRRGPRRRHRPWPGDVGLCGVHLSRADVWVGSSGTWEVLPSPDGNRSGESRTVNSRSAGFVPLARRERSTKHTVGYRQSKATKCGEMGGRMA